MSSKHGLDENDNSFINKKKIIILLLILLFILVVIGCAWYILTNKNIEINRSADNLNGTWTTDGVTIYEFDGKGKGTMRVPASNYDFTYIIHDNQIYIDFKDEKAKDSDYEFSIEDNKLVFKGIKATTGTYTFTKQ